MIFCKNNRFPCSKENLPYFKQFLGKTTSLELDTKKNKTLETKKEVDTSHPRLLTKLESFDITRYIADF